MSTITGPKIQIPSAGTPLVTEDRSPSIDYMTYLHSLNDTLFATTRSGPTSSRPTSSMPGRFIGMSFFDTDLSKPVFLKTASTDVWVDGSGSVV